MQDIMSDSDIRNSESVLKFFYKELDGVSRLLTTGRIIQAHNDICRLKAQAAKALKELDESKESSTVDV